MDKSLKRNTFIARFFFVLLLFSLLIQLFRVQVLENKKWQIKSESRNYLHRVYQATRGSVFFADGSPLAISQLAYGIYAIPEHFELKSVKAKNITKESFSEEVAKILDITKESVYEKITNPNFKYIALAHKVDPQVVDKIKEKYSDDLFILDYEEQSKRVYPNGTLASKIIGFVGKDEEGNDRGNYGIEEYFDGVLKGTDGLFQGKKDNQGQVIAGEEFENINSRNGIDITLTIDKSIQSMLEERLWYWLNELKAKEVTAVILEPNTGRLLASANLPTYDPNKYWEGEWVNCESEYYVINKKCNIEEKKPEPTPTPEGEKKPDGVSYPEGYEERLRKIEEEKQRLLDEEERIRKEIERTNPTPEVEVVDPRVAHYGDYVREIFRKESLPPAEVYRNTANSYLYEPGSVVKPATVAISYQNHAIPTDPDFQLGGHDGCTDVVDITLCAYNKIPRESETVKEMLKFSDNVGAIRTADPVNTLDFINGYKSLGLGNVTRIELSGEAKYAIKEPTQWTLVDKATASYGQGSIAFTPLQLTHMWNILASEGKIFKPTIVQSIKDDDKKREFSPEYIGEALDQDAARNAIYVNAIASSESIPAARDFYTRYPFSGKTGTANIPNPDAVGYLEDVYNISYLGSAPLETPRFSMLIWFREPRLGYGGVAAQSTTTAQLAWLDIAERLVVLMKIPPQNQ